MVDRYDAGLLNDFGGGNVEWWQDYLRAELERAHDFYADQIEAAERLAGARVKALEWRGTEGVWAKADALFGATYRITEYAGMAKPFKLETIGFVGPSGHYELIDDAKAAAQADYERRILAALAQPAGEAEPSKWSIPGSSYAGASTPPDASAIREAEPCQFLPTEDGEFNGNTFSDEPVPFGWITQRAYNHAFTTSDPVQVTILRNESGPGLMPRVALYTTPPASAIREALEPFARAWDRVVEERPDAPGEVPFAVMVDEHDNSVIDLTWGDLRRAHAALAGAKP